jgi:DNA (cytosine-5)-methyltransferase 1
MLTSRGLGRVLGDLASMGFDARWGVLGAADVGANHQRDRIWIIARWRGQVPYTQHDRIRRWEQQQESVKKKNVGNAISNRRSERRNDNGEHDRNQFATDGQHSCALADTTSIRQQESRKHEQSINSKKGCDWKANYVESIGSSNFWSAEPNLGRVANGVAARVDRLKAIGNGQVPLCAAEAWRILSGGA